MEQRDGKVWNFICVPERGLNTAGLLIDNAGYNCGVFIRNEHVSPV